MRQKSVKILENESMAVDITSQGIDLISAYAYSIQAVWSGGSSPVGLFKLQCSNDPGDNGSGQGVSQPTNWTDVTDSIQPITDNSGSIVYDVTECSYRWVRFVYDASSGSATLTSAIINTKGV